MALGKFKVAISADISNIKSAGKEISQTIGDSVDPKKQGFGKKLLGGLGGFGSQIGKGLAVGAAGGITALGGLGAAAISAQADIQQSLGGAEAVFQQNSGEIKTWAAGAAASMGISADAALQTANKMGSLFQGSGHTVEKSAEMSMEMSKRAADVASVMGVDLASAMEAVTGAAKGNYSMMDNLGVAMNETSLAAYAAEKGIEGSWKSMSQAEKTGIAYQLFMEKTSKYAGNFEKENQTLAGSFDILKGSMANVMQSMGDPQMMEGAMAGLKDALFNVIESLKIALPPLIEGLGTLLAEGLPMIFEALSEVLPELGGMISTLLPKLMESLTAALPGLLAGLVAVIQALLPGVLTGIGALIQGIVAQLPSLIGILLVGLAELIPTLIMGIGELIWQIFFKLDTSWLEALGHMLGTIVTWLAGAAGPLLQSAITWLMNFVTGFGQMAVTFWSTLGSWAATLFSKIIGFAGQLLSTAFSLWWNIVSAFLNFQLQFWTTLAGFIGSLLSRVIGWGGQLLSAAASAFSSIVSAYKTAAQNLWNALTAAFSSIIGWITGWGSTLKSTATSIFNNAIGAIVGVVSGLWGKIRGFFTGIPGQIASSIGDLSGIGRALVQGIWSGISGAGGWLKDKIGGFGSSVVGGFKSVFRIGSPSKVMADQIGYNLGTGVSLGLDNSLSSVLKDADSFSNELSDRITVDPTVDIGTEGGLYAAARNGLDSRVVNVNQTVDKPESLLDLYLLAKRGANAGFAY